MGVGVLITGYGGGVSLKNDRHQQAHECTKRLGGFVSFRVIGVRMFGYSSWILPLWVLRSLGWTGDAVGRIRGRRFVFDSDASDKLGGSAWFSSNKIESMLGFRPKWDLEKALPEMVREMEKGK